MTKKQNRVVKDTLDLLTRLSGQPISPDQLLVELCEMLLPSLEAIYAKDFYPEALQSTMVLSENCGEQRTYTDKKETANFAVSLPPAPEARKDVLEPRGSVLKENQWVDTKKDAEASVQAARRALASIHPGSCSSGEVPSARTRGVMDGPLRIKNKG